MMGMCKPSMAPIHCAHFELKPSTTYNSPYPIENNLQIGASFRMWKIEEAEIGGLH